MVSPRKRRLVRDESDTDSDAEVVVCPTKRQRRIICADDDDDDAQFWTDRFAVLNKADVALLQSLNASQRPSTSPLPTLPAEILLTILEYVPAAHVLDLRLVSRSFRTAIDTRVFYHHIQQVELVGYLGNYNDNDLMKELSPDDYWRFALVRAHFAGLDGWKPGQARWKPKRAVFRPISAWIDTLHGIGGEMQPVNPWWDHVLGCLDLEFPPQVYSQLRWCVKAGGVALDIGIPDGLGEDTDIEMLGDDEGVVFKVTDWKALLWNLFSEERALNALLEETKDATHYTYGHLQDCLRSMRRKRFVNALDPDKQEDRNLIWKINNLRPLFGKPNFHNIQETYQDVYLAEEDAISTITLLRREAAMSPSQHSAVQRLLSDRAAMRAEHEIIDTAFKKWQERALGLPSFSLPRLELEALDDEDEQANPLMWPEDKLRAMQETVGQWKGQREMIRQMVGLLDTTNAVAELDEGDFIDDDGEF